MAETGMLFFQGTPMTSLRYWIMDFRPILLFPTDKSTLSLNYIMLPPFLGSNIIEITFDSIRHPQNPSLAN